MKTKSEISKLPTIIDVLERLSQKENNIHLNQKSIISSDLDDIGRYIVVRDGKNNDFIRLMSTPIRATYYRGQNTFFPYCRPTLFRGLSIDDIAIQRVKSYEFHRLLFSHPIIQEFERQKIVVDYCSIAQHYGFATNVLDITKDKWVAAFFAATFYDKTKNTYIPTDESFENGYGVIYVSKENANLEYNDRFFEIGYQFLTRPSKQSSYGFSMDEKENDISSIFDAVEFRHNAQASQWIYEMAYKQRKFIPNDYVSDKAIEILSSNYVTNEAVFRCYCDYYSNLPVDYLPKLCNKYGIVVGDEPAIRFSDSDIRQDIDRWENFERIHIKNSIVPMPLVSVLNLSDTD